jgi:glutamyl-tRNA synthetase
VRYPGTCLELSADEAEERLAAGTRHAWRFRVASRVGPGFHDLACGRRGDALPPPGDFVVWRSDEVPAYQLAVVVDDREMGITEVVRGDDLLPSTTKQILLYGALGHAPPAFGHVPLLLGPDGVRLSKRHRGVTLRELRERGFTSEAIVGRLACLVGLRATPEPVPARALVDGFSLGRIRPAPDGIVVDPSEWS